MIRLVFIIFFTLTSPALAFQGMGPGPGVKAYSGGVSGNSDTFTGTNGTLLATHDSNWVSIDSSFVVSNFNIQSNQLQPTGVWSEAGAFYNTSTSDVSQVVFKSGATYANGTSRAVCVRANTNNAGYCAYFDGVSGGNFQNISIRKNISEWLAGSSGSWSTASDHTVRITATGTTSTTISIYLDGSGTPALTYVDSTSAITTGHPGFLCYPDGTMVNSVLDTWTDQ